MKVKICGITNIDDALLCENLGADALGFIFYKQSRRYINPEDSIRIIKKLSAFTLKVGVFVNETAEFINQMASETKLNAVQLHGEENPEIMEELNFPVIKAFRINGRFDYLLLERYKNASILLDSFSSNGYGGTGKKFDWEKIPNEVRGKIIISGGVSSENIEFIFNEIKPAAVDLSSSVEKVPGKKDEEKVNEFFKKLNYLRSKKW